MRNNIILAGGFLTSLFVHAEIVYYDLPVEGTINPKTYINKKSGVKIGLSAGLDRKTELKLKNSSGIVLYRELSDYITVSDRITNNLGEDFYGKVFELPLLADQGEYTIEQNVFDMDGNQIKSNQKVRT